MARLNVEGKHDGFEWRRYVWNVTCSPKIKQLLWKLKHKVLAVSESLVKRGGREMQTLWSLRISDPRHVAMPLLKESLGFQSGLIRAK